MTEAHLKQKIGLALSGGGVRAAAFHAGVLQWLAEQQQLENVVHISSVSGGSLLTGLIFHTAGYAWPSSTDYTQKVFPSLSDMLTKHSLQARAIAALLINPFNWRYLLSRANVFAKTIEALWGIHGPLSDLPANPIWSINGTTFENGRRFRFKNTKAGDYELGYADVRDYKLASAMAMSAAFPGGIGPLAFDPKAFSWRKRDTWDSQKPENEIPPPFERLHLYDGGVYDNLGMEPLFDLSTKKIKESSGGVDHIIVSDAGAPLMAQEPPWRLELLRLKRIYGITSNQARALRVRCFVKFLQENIDAGMYLEIGSDPIAKLKQFNAEIRAADLWLSSKQVEDCASVSTSLKRLSRDTFKQLSRHGYETAKWNSIAFNNRTLAHIDNRVA